MTKTAFLQGRTAKKLYATVKDFPIVDYHCHLSPKEIYEDIPFSNIGEIWLSADHYKWRLMRTAGIDERYITGKDTSWKEKFLKYAEAIEFSAGHPLYHWSHMELMQYFHIHTPLSSKTAEQIWEAANRYIAETDMSARKLIAQSNVETICTADDITDDLCWHEKIAQDPTFPVSVLPSFRTDHLMPVNLEHYSDYIKKLASVSGVEIRDLPTLKTAVRQRLVYFVEHGCRCSDIGIPMFPDWIADEARADEIFRRILSGEAVSDEQIHGLLGNLYVYLNGLYKEFDLLSNWHLAVVRNPNATMYAQLGVDCGADCVGNVIDGNSLIRVLNTIQVKTGLPKVILYSLNNSNISQIASIAASFPNVCCGAAWWFCDHKRGIEEQLNVISENACLGGFYGMVTDSRSFLSYARHDYFRQILCSVLGQWVESGQYDEQTAIKLAAKISYENIKKALRKDT